MKYYIVSTFEMDGHSSALSIICDGAAAKQKYLQEILYNEDTKQYYPTSHKVENEDGSTTIYGEWDCGEWSINIIPFKTFKEICNKERFTRTG